MKLLFKGEGFHVPTVEEMFNWQTIAGFDVGPIHFNISWLTIFLFSALAIMMLVFGLGAGRAKLIPSGLQAGVENAIDFVRQNIVVPAIGTEGEKFMPLLCSMFFFIFSLNVLAVIPPIQFPISSHIAFPVVLSVISYVVFNVVAIKSQGLGHYVKGVLFPPGVPKGIYVILTPVEFLSNFIFRPLTLAIRLFANMMAGHVMLTIFFLATAYFGLHGEGLFLRLLTPFPFVMGIALIGFELFVGAIQAFIFTILTAVYIAGAMHPEH